tara:strand:+ start:46663 stop:48006 length:1344 start_codon:yes stop_codon:yes gene_type:complete
MSTPIVRALAVASVLFLCAACDGGGGDGESGDGGTIRFINAVSDASTLGMEIEEVSVASVAYGHSSERLSYIAGTKSLTFYQVLADGDTQALDVVFDVALDADEEILVVLYGSMQSIQSLVVEVEAFDLNEGTGRVGLLMLSQHQPQLDMYLTREDEGLFETTPVLSEEYGGFAGMIDIEEGDYELEFTRVGEKEAVYDAGTIDIDEDENYFIAVLDDFGTQANAIIAIEMVGDSADRELVGDNTPAGLRFVNGIADYPSVDVYLGDTASEPLFSNVVFGDATDYVSVAADDYSLNVTPHGVTDTFFYEDEFSLLAGELSTLVAAGLSMQDDTSGTLVSDTLRSVAIGAQMSFVHASPSNQMVDIYVLLPGQPITDTSPVVAGLSYLLAYDYERAAGDYELVVIQSDNGATILGPIALALEQGDNLDLYLMDNEGGGTPGSLEIYKF